MDKAEAGALLREHLGAFRLRRYADLVQLIGNADCRGVTGPSGVRYEVEVVVVWDRACGGNVRVMVSIDDGGFRATVKPVTDCFIKAPDETFVGESS